MEKEPCMNEIERAIDIVSTYNNTIAVNPDFECAMDAAIAALREQVERSKGCEHCRGWDSRCGANYCPMCGKRLEVKHEAD